MTSTNEILASISNQVRASEYRIKEKIDVLQKELERRHATEGIISEAIPVIEETVDGFGLRIKGVTITAMPNAKEGDHKVHARFFVETRYSANRRATQEQGVMIVDELRAAFSNCEEISFVLYNFEEHGYNFYITLSR